MRCVAFVVPVTALVNGCNVILGLESLQTGSGNSSVDSGADGSASDSGADGSPRDGGAGSSGTFFAYVSNYGNGITGSISQFNVLDSGVLSGFGTPVSLPNGAGLAILGHPNNKFVYALSGQTSCGNCNNNITAFSVGAAKSSSPGSLTLATGVPWVTGNYASAFGMTLDGTAGLLLATSSYNIQVFSVNSTTGGLVPRNPASTSGFTANANNFTGIATSPTIASAYLINNSGTVVIQEYSLNLTSDPALSPIAAAAPTQPNNNFSSVATNPKSAYLYTANNGTGTLSVYPISSFGMLGDAGADIPAGGPGVNGVLAHPNGTFVYALNSTTNQIFYYTFDPTAGALTAGGNVQLLASLGPVWMAIDPLGLFLYIVYQTSSQIGMFAINQSTGAPTPLSPPTVTTGTKPTQITLVRAL